MKSIYESEETFKAYATIDAGYFIISQIQCNCKNSKKTILNIIEIAESIISAKKIIEADYYGDEKLVNKLQSLIKSNYEKTNNNTTTQLFADSSAGKCKPIN